jgi:GNAT superfamily N-acetyltransferase
MQGSGSAMSNPDLKVEILVQGVEDWLKRELPGWATRTRFHARRVDGNHVLVLTARDTREDVGYAVFDKELSHLYYMETRKDRRRRGVAERLWEKVKASAVHRDITATADSEEGKRRLQVWGFVELEGIWSWSPLRLVGEAGTPTSESVPLPLDRS